MLRSSKYRISVVLDKALISMRLRQRNSLCRSLMLMGTGKEFERRNLMMKLNGNLQHGRMSLVYTVSVICLHSTLCILQYAAKRSM